jgi:hypothetical protein
MRAIVDAPRLRRAAHGLVETAAQRESARWEDGVAFTPWGCNVIFGHAPQCPSEDKSNYQECRLLEADPWLLETGLVWATGDLAANPKEHLIETMEIGTSSVLERLTAIGVVDTAAGTPINAPNPSAALSTVGVTGRVMAGATPPPTLASTALVAAGPYTPKQALGAIEAKLLDSSDHVGGAGTVMMSALYAVELNGLVVERENGLFTFATGSRVVVGNFPPGTIWGVIGDVSVYLSEIEVYETVHRVRNELVLRAERYALAAWNCAAFAATVAP